MVNGLAIEDEIKAFQENLTKAWELLSVSYQYFSHRILDVHSMQVLQDINLSVGVDEILNQISEVRELQNLQHVSYEMYIDPKIEIYLTCISG